MLPSNQPNQTNKPNQTNQQNQPTNQPTKQPNQPNKVGQLPLSFNSALTHSRSTFGVRKSAPRWERWVVDVWLRVSEGLNQIWFVTLTFRRFALFRDGRSIQFTCFRASPTRAIASRSVGPSIERAPEQTAPCILGFEVKNKTRTKLLG